jgi:hypothetical protein
MQAGFVTVLAAKASEDRLPFPDPLLVLANLILILDDHFLAPIKRVFSVRLYWTPDQRPA